MTAAEPTHLAAELRTSTLEVQGATEQARMRGLTVRVEIDHAHD